jgi:hypothetical protein
MSRIGTFVIIGITIAAAVWARRLAIQLLAPGTKLYEMAATATMFGGEQLANQIYQAVVVYVPWFLVIAAILGGLYREFWQAQVTRRAR